MDSLCPDVHRFSDVIRSLSVCGQILYSGNPMLKECLLSNLATSSQSPLLLITGLRNASVETKHHWKLNDVPGC
ncbi:hypothetical protein H5410_055264 [Solanum commersonii]|uniref:Uncharacterized protein n=1 Tax=Solanum commersonii TaxID=4109 RepID=A0A9J5WHR8_SOLCO|nr:hypothetical protein H5410_055264 [Solanum commersonii]